MEITRIGYQKALNSYLPRKYTFVERVEITRGPGIKMGMFICNLNVITKEGFYFKINTTGANTDHPTICSNVVVKYKGTLTNGTKFDENTTGISFPLSNLIIGWQEGIPLISIGGKITLYLPPSLGYGAVAQQNIPANSILIFDIELVSF
jgi:FKBP-type peptidyl-prolyl cis-trans isomerase